MPIRDFQIEIYLQAWPGAAPLLPMAGRDWKASAPAALPPSMPVDGYPSFKDLTPDAVSIEIGEPMRQLTALVGGGTLNP